MTARVCRFEIDRSHDGLWFVRFRAANGKKLVVSETYQRRREAVNVIRVLKADAATAEVREVAS